MDSRIIKKFLAGNLYNAYNYFGAHFTDEGVRFAVYAPHALEVELTGSFNNWDGSKHKMKRTSEFGVFEITVPNIHDYDNYKYHIRTSQNIWIDKIDPFAFYSELRPGNSSRVFDLDGFYWNDAEHMKKRNLSTNSAMNIYELHIGSWIRSPYQNYYSYEDIAPKLISYVKSLGYTHVEIMPLSEHPLDMSWGYQSSGFYSITSRYGNPKQLMQLINLLHQAGLGVIFDFVPVHFVKDAWGLVDYDGESLFETSDVNNKFNSWGSVNFDLSKNHVRSFLISVCDFYVNVFHADGIRVDAVSNLIFYQGNRNNGEHIVGIKFVKDMNSHIKDKYPKVVVIAEDSSDYQGVTTPVENGGLGFDYKWDLGWMNDTLKYYSVDPIFRKYDHSKITFSMYYFYTEKFLLPFSHDEVVHGKGTILNKMWGSYEQKFAQCRNLYTYMYTHPGKKLNFMGNELGQFREWDESKELDWSLLDVPMHQKYNRFIRDLNYVYLAHPALYQYDYDKNNFKWIMVDNSNQSIFAFYRENADEVLVTVLNMTPNYYDYYELGVPYAGTYEEIINSDKQVYGGWGQYNGLPLTTGPNPLNGFQQRVGFKLASFGAMIWLYKKNKQEI